MTTLKTDIIDRDRGWRPWGKGYLYDVNNPTGFVPNPKDWIIDPDTNLVYRVETVNYADPSWTTKVINGIPANN